MTNRRTRQPTDTPRVLEDAHTRIAELREAATRQHQMAKEYSDLEHHCWTANDRMVYHAFARRASEQAERLTRRATELEEKRVPAGHAA